MKSKNFFKGLMSLLIVASSVSLSCKNTSKSNVENTEHGTDSVYIKYNRIGYLPFVDTYPDEFTHDLTDSCFIFKDSTTIKMLTERIAKLDVDSIHYRMDIRIMLIFYSDKNDTLWVSSNPLDNMQINRKIVKPDSSLWVKIRDLLIDRDSIFKHNFKDAPGYD